MCSVVFVIWGVGAVDAIAWALVASPSFDLRPRAGKVGDAPLDPVPSRGKASVGEWPSSSESVISKAARMCRLMGR